MSERNKHLSEILESLFWEALMEKINKNYGYICIKIVRVPIIIHFKF